MAAFNIDVDPVSPSTAGEGYRGAETGHLRSVAVSFRGPLIDFGRVYVQVGSMLGGRGTEYVVAMFINAYVSNKFFPGWTGDYPFSPYEEIFVRAWANTSRTVRVMGKIDIGDC